MTNVRMMALDTLHVSSVSSDSMLAGTEFDVPGYVADDLEGRGLASRVVVAPPAPVPAPEPEPVKAEPQPIENKMEPAPVNKAKASRRQAIN